MSEVRVGRQVCFYGRVQGVGFRQTTCDTARRFRVVGFVQNRPDGSVLLRAEGEPAELDRFLAAVLDERARYVTRHDVEPVAVTNEFDEFFIQY